MDASLNKRININNLSMNVVLWGFCSALLWFLQGTNDILTTLLRRWDPNSNINPITVWESGNVGEEQSSVQLLFQQSIIPTRM